MERNRQQGKQLKLFIIKPPNPVLQPTAFGGLTRGFTGLVIVLVLAAILCQHRRRLNTLPLGPAPQRLKWAITLEVGTKTRPDNRLAEKTYGQGPIRQIKGDST
jgi:hypothetical protein